MSNTFILNQNKSHNNSKNQEIFFFFITKFLIFLIIKVKFNIIFSTIIANNFLKNLL